MVYPYPSSHASSLALRPYPLASTSRSPPTPPLRPSRRQLAPCASRSSRPSSRLLLSSLPRYTRSYAPPPQIRTTHQTPTWQPETKRGDAQRQARGCTLRYGRVGYLAYRLRGVAQGNKPLLGRCLVLRSLVMASRPCNHRLSLLHLHLRAPDDTPPALEGRSALSAQWWWVGTRAAAAAAVANR